MREDDRPARFEQAVLPHLGAAYNLARWLTRNDHDAEDVVQEAYLRAHQFFDGFRGGDGRAWLLRIVRNTCYTWLEKNRPGVPVAQFDEEKHGTAPPGAGPDAPLLVAEDQQLLRRALEGLPAEYREAVVLRELEGLSYKEIAAVAGVPLGTVMSRLARARERLHHCLTGRENEGPDVTCEEISGLLPAYADGELDALRGAEVERHLAGCPACAAAHARGEALRAALADPSLYHAAPPGLRERLRASLRKEARPRRRLVARLRRPLAVAAAVALVALAGWGAIRALSAPSAEELLAREVTSDHVRSLMAAHLFDIASTRQHQIKPWFNGRVDFAPDVRDFAAEGFPLEGARVEDIDGKRAAALVYKRRDHVINLFEWPAESRAEPTPRALTQRGFHLVRWGGGGLNYWVVSDLNERELAEFVELLRR